MNAPSPYDPPPGGAHPYNTHPYSTQPYNPPSYGTPPYEPYGYPGHPYPPYQYPYPAPRTNALAIASLVCAFLFAPLGIVFGHLSLSQIRRSGEDGRGLALAGMVIGYVVTIATILAVVAATLLFAWAARVVRESSDPGGAGIPRYRASAPLDPTPLAPTPLAPTPLAPSPTVAHKPQAALVTR
jgi:peptidyl-prolyl cis-trans isomerase B (cyclophilin B)